MAAVITSLSAQVLNALLMQSYGYLSANDLLSWIDAQLIQSRLNIQPNSVLKACQTGVSEVRSRLYNVYDLGQELSKSDTVPAAATCALTGGLVSAVTITGAGTNFTASPIVTATNAAGDTTGSGAVLTPVISASVISSIELLTCGGRFLTAPNVSFIGGGGTGATATATIDNFGHVNSVVLTNGGTGWTSIPQVVFASTDGFGLGASAVCTVAFGKLTGLTITNGGTLYTLPPVINITGGQADDTRNPRLVKLCSIYAVRNLMGPGQSLSDKMLSDFKMADTMIQDMREGQDSLPFFPSIKQVRSNAQLIQDNFRQLG